MSDPAVRLEAASAAVRERDLILGQLSSLGREYEAARIALERRRAEWSAETEDVAELESISLTRILAGLRGTRATDLEREHAEAETARLRVAETQALSEALGREREQLSDRLRALGDVDAAYRDAQAAHEAWLTGQGGPAAARLAALAQERGRLQAELRELTEADRAAYDAAVALQTLITAVDNALGWQTYDAVYTGSLPTALSQGGVHQILAAAAHANQRLASLARELVDVTGGTVPALTMTDGLVANWFAPILVDTSAGHRIEETKRHAQHTLQAVAAHHHNITQRRSEVERRLAHLEQRRTDVLNRGLK